MADLFQDDTTTVDPTKNYLEELVGEGKKFQTPEELARGKAEADAFIAKIAEENKQLRDELKSRASLQEFLDRMEEERKNVNPITPSNHDDQQITNQPTITKETVESLVQEVITKSQKTAQEDRNLDLVLETLSAQFGPNVQQVIAARGQELGLGKQYLTNLAKEQPKAFLALMGVDTTPPPVQPQRTVTTTRTNPSSLNPQKKNFQHYENLRKTDFATYSSAKIHNEMLAALAEQGDDFYK